MAFIDALKIVSVDVFLYVATGDWLPNFLSTNRVKRVRLAFKEIQGYMSEMIREKESSLESLNESADLFSNLIRANHDPDIEDRLKLTEEELIGRRFLKAQSEMSPLTFFFQETSSSFSLLVMKSVVFFNQEKRPSDSNLQDVSPYSLLCIRIVSSTSGSPGDGL